MLLLLGAKPVRITNLPGQPRRAWFGLVWYQGACAMNVGQVIECAREWVELYGRHTPGFCGAHRYQNAAVANKTLTLVRERGAKGFVVQADVARPKEISRMVELIQAEFGTPDIFLG